jgi:hypothetical protein
MTTPVCTARPLVLLNGTPQEAPDTDFVQLADVATSGAYADLSGTPTLGTAAATDSTAYATAAQGTTADNAIPKPSTGLAAQTTLADADQFVLQESGGTVKKTLWNTLQSAVQNYLLAQASAWTAKQSFGNYTVLGESAPAIKCKKLTGTTASAINTNVAIPHGLSISKIVGINVVLGYGDSIGFQADIRNEHYAVWQWSGAFYISVLVDQSPTILSQPFSILVWYEE